MTHVTADGEFNVGVEYDGKRFTKFQLRQKLIRDSVEAIEELGGEASQARLDVAVLARQLSIPGVPQEAITTELVLDLDDIDMVALDGADDAVKKKRLALNATSKPNAN